MLYVLELGANLLGQERVQFDNGEGTEGFSGLSTVNSIKSQKTSDSLETKYWREYRDQISNLKSENLKLMQELVDNQKSYQTLLQQALEYQRTQITVLSQLCDLIKQSAKKEAGLVRFSKN